MTKIVILGSCRYAPYEILAVPEKNQKWNTEEGYQMATQKFYPAIEQADEVWVYAPAGIGEHTQRDIEFAIKTGKTIRIMSCKANDKEFIKEKRILASASGFCQLLQRQVIDASSYEELNSIQKQHAENCLQCKGNLYIVQI